MSFAFTTPVFLRPSGRRGNRTSCQQTNPTVTSQSTITSQQQQSWDKQTQWNMDGQGVQAKGLQTIEFIIRQDGSVEEKVTGIAGKDCTKVTAEIEKALGRVVHTEKTEEYFQEVYETMKESQKIQDITQPGDPLHVSDPTIGTW